MAQCFRPCLCFLRVARIYRAQAQAFLHSHVDSLYVHARPTQTPNGPVAPGEDTLWVVAVTNTGSGDGGMRVRSPRSACHICHAKSVCVCHLSAILRTHFHLTHLLHPATLDMQLLAASPSFVMSLQSIRRLYQTLQNAPCLTLLEPNSWRQGRSRCSHLHSK